MRRSLHFHNYDEVLADADALLAKGYARAGHWGLGQVCNHLAATMEKSLDGFPSLMPWPVRVVARWFVLKKVLRHEPFRRTVSAPAYLLPPDSDDDRAGLERLRSVVARLKAHVGELRPSPVFGRLSAEEWREVHLWHCEHHLSFLRPSPSSV
jgi:uncharacterized protein DUF1569